MQFSFLPGLLLVLVSASLGGALVKLLKFPPILGFILSGVLFSSFVDVANLGIEKLAEIGIILLLFSLGLELSLKSLARFAKIVLLGSILQMVVVVILVYWLLAVFDLSSDSRLILGMGFALSSTAVVIKMLTDRGELDSLHGQIAAGWLLVQDLAVVPMLIVIPALAGGTSPIASIAVSLGKSLLVVVGVIVIGRLITPFIMHKLASLNSREILILSSMSLAIGTAIFTSFLGISPALGAFLAGLVISESQEHHAVFAETRPLRDLFVALFFVSLGFLVTPLFIMHNIVAILVLVLLVILVKILVIFSLTTLLGYKGKTAIFVSLSLSQVGEFAFVIFSLAVAKNIISNQIFSLGIAVALVSLLVTPFLFKSQTAIWYWIKGLSSKGAFCKRLFSPSFKGLLSGKEGLKNHIVICGYGRVGSWVGRAVESLAIPLVVVEYNPKVVDELKEKGIKVIYGDPSEKEVLDLAGIQTARAVVLAIPDRALQESVIANIQTLAPQVKIIARAHLDEDWEKLKTLKVEKIIQPEFEAALAIVRSILVSLGRSKEEIGKSLKSLRVSHAKT